MAIYRKKPANPPELVFANRHIVVMMQLLAALEYLYPQERPDAQT